MFKEWKEMSDADKMHHLKVGGAIGMSIIIAFGAGKVFGAKQATKEFDALLQYTSIIAQRNEH